MDHQDFLSSLRPFGIPAILQYNEIKRTPGALEWVYNVATLRSPHVDSQSRADETLAHWLAAADGLFWITGKPGSGESSTTKYIYDNSWIANSLRRSIPRLETFQDPSPASPHDLHDDPRRNLSLDSAASGQACQATDTLIIRLFITNRGLETQSLWCTMIYGVLLQLLEKIPALLRIATRYGLIRQNSQTPTSPIAAAPTIEPETYPWNEEEAHKVLAQCMEKTGTKYVPFLLWMDSMSLRRNL